MYSESGSHGHASLSRCRSFSLSFSLSFFLSFSLSLSLSIYINIQPLSLSPRLSIRSNMCPPTFMYVFSYCYMCPPTFTYVSSYRRWSRGHKQWC